MSLALISETASEVHRLAIAGSGLAAGDYRLLRLLPQLEALVAKSPVFGRIAQSVKTATGEKDAATAGRALLDVATLLTAIQYTQSPHGVAGEFEPLQSEVKEWTPTVAGYRSLSAVVEALTSTGQGRLEVVKDACLRGLFKDLRLLKPAMDALGDKFGELADYVAGHCLPQFGPVIMPLLLEGFDPKGGKSHSRRVTAYCRLNPEAGRAFCRRVLHNATKEVKLAVIEGLAGSEADLDTIIELTKERSGDVRHAAILALRGTTDPKAISLARELLSKEKDPTNCLVQAAVSVIAGSGVPSISVETLTEIESLLPDVEKNMDFIGLLLKCLEGNRTEYVRDTLLDMFRRLIKTLPGGKALNALQGSGSFASGHVDVLSGVAERLLAMKDAVADRALAEARGSGLDILNLISLAASARLMDAEEIFDAFSPILRKAKEQQWTRAYLASGTSQFCSDDGDGVIPHFPRQLVSKRWTSIFIELGLLDEVAQIAQPGQVEAAVFLRKAAARCKPAAFAESIMHAPAIATIDPEGSVEWLFDRVRVLQSQKSVGAWQVRHLWKALSLLPPSALPHFEKAAGSIAAPWLEEFENIHAQLRQAAAGQQP